MAIEIQINYNWIVCQTEFKNLQSSVLNDHYLFIWSYENRSSIHEHLNKNIPAMTNIFMSETNFELYKNAGLLIRLKKYTLNA